MNQTAHDEVVEKTAGVTTFLDDDQVQMTSKVKLDVSNLKTGVVPFHDRTLTNFFERPVQIATSTWSTASTAGTTLASNSIASLLEAQSIWTNKMRGFNLVRGKAVLKLQLNSTPFHQGRLILHYLPCLAELELGQTGYATMHNINLMSITQHPHVEIDCRDAAGTIEIPYITPSNWYNRDSAQYDWGRWYLTVLSPLVAGSGQSSTIEYTMWLHFDNFEMAAPAYNSQASGGSSHNLPDSLGVKKLVKWKPQVKRNQFANSDVESSQDSGPIASLMTKITASAAILATVPVLTPWAAPVAAISAVAAGVATVFGWSKPLADKPADPFYQRPTKNLLNTDGTAPSEIFSLTAANKLNVLPGFAGTDLDEMSFAFLKKVRCFFTSVSWATTDVTDTELLSIDVKPTTFFSGVTVTGATYQELGGTFPPFVYVSNMFRQYRGGIEITLKFVKTDFHSGRLSINFDPVGTTVINANAPFVLREVIDLRTSNEVTLRIPYLKSTEYIPVSESLGTISIRVLNELRAPTTAPQNIAMMLFVNAAPDFELQIPRDTLYLPWVAQMDTSPNDRSLLVDSNIGGAPIPSNINVMDSASCVGEHFLSIKQLINCPRRFQEPDLTDSNLKTSARMWPFCIGLTKFADTTEPTQGPMTGDYISFFAPGYVFSRGGVRFVYNLTGANGSMKSNMVWDSSGTIDCMSSTVDGSLTDGNQYLGGYTGRSNLSPETFLSSTNGCLVDLVAPHYGATPTRLNYGQFASGSTVPDHPDVPRTLIQLKTSGSVTNSADTVLRGGFDDYQLGFFIGFPPLLMSHSTIIP